MINVIGLGYIGLPTALMLAAHGQEVVGTDLSEAVVSNLNNGRVSLMEAGIEDLYRRALDGGIRFSTRYQKADIYIISVPTPYIQETKQVDAAYVEAAVKTVLGVCPKGAILVIESTISPGTIDKQIRPLIGENGFTVGEDIFLVHAPERIIPGNMLYELEHNNRTVGADQKEIGIRVRDIYASFCKGEITLTDIRTAEMTKVVENTFRAVNIAFANELAKICRENGLNVYEVINICNKHPRVNILQPGPGVGGHCISVDPWFLVGDYPQIATVTAAAMHMNAEMPQFVLKRIRKIMQEHGMKDLSRVGLYGLAYKANVDDCRESPGLQLQQVVNDFCAMTLTSYDPYVSRELLPNQQQDFDAFLDRVDLVAVLVGHDEIRKNAEKLRGKIVLDCCNLPELAGAYHL
jgi:UDP-N-acetyl-D-mannosaminuronic acid dehydrogenase